MCVDLKRLLRGRFLDCAPPHNAPKRARWRNSKSRIKQPLSPSVAPPCVRASRATNGNVISSQSQPATATATATAAAENRHAHDHDCALFNSVCWIFSPEPSNILPSFGQFSKFGKFGTTTIHNRCHQQLFAVSSRRGGIKTILLVWRTRVARRDDLSLQ